VWWKTLNRPSRSVILHLCAINRCAYSGESASAISSERSMRQRRSVCAIRYRGGGAPAMLRSAIRVWRVMLKVSPVANPREASSR